MVDKLLLNGRLYTTSEIPTLPSELQPQYASTVTKENITGFFSENSPLSNHHKSDFSIDGLTFTSNEQYFMYSKASHFQDTVTAQDILNTQNPKRAKFLGKQVKNFRLCAWRLVCDEYMRKGLKEKFGQNKHLGEFLLKTGSTSLAEANPHDDYWGVGLSLKDDRIWRKNEWKGRNTLGSLLEETRNSLKTNQ